VILPIPRSGRRRFSRHAAPRTFRAASASASRSSTVPLLPISPAVRSQRPTVESLRDVARNCPAQPDLEVVGMRPKHQEIDSHQRLNSNALSEVSSASWKYRSRTAAGEIRAGHAVWLESPNAKR